MKEKENWMIRRIAADLQILFNAADGNVHAYTLNPMK